MASTISLNHHSWPARIGQIESDSYAVRKLAIYDQEGISFIELKDIVYCESERSYTIIHLTSGRKIVSTKTLKEFENRLSSYPFFRIHHNSLINLYAVSRFLKEDGGLVVMTNGKRIYVSRRKKALFLDIIGHLQL